MLDTTRPGSEDDSVAGAVNVPGGGAAAADECRCYIDTPGALMMYITSLP